MAGVTERECAVEPLLSAYIDGELQPGEIDTVAGHLPGCGTCGPTFRAFKDMRSLIRGLDPVVLPAHLESDVVDAFAVPLSHAGDRLSAYLDGEITGTELDAVTIHLIGCNDCRSELHDIDAARTAIRSLPRIDPPALGDLYRLPVVSGDAGTSPPEDKPGGRLAHRWRVVAAAAVAAAVAVTVAVSLGDRDGTATIDLDRLADHHVARVAVGSGASVIPAVSPRQDVP